MGILYCRGKDSTSRGEIESTFERYTLLLVRRVDIVLGGRVCFRLVDSDVGGKITSRGDVDSTSEGRGRLYFT